MQKTLTYSIFTIASLFTILAFVTAKSYTQLAVAIILYPAVAYFGLRIFSRKPGQAQTIALQMPIKTVSAPQKAESRKSDNIGDVDKRTFLKMVGAAGLSFFVFSLLGRRVETLLFGQSPDPGLLLNTQALPGNDGSTAGASPTDGYKISEIDENVTSYYGFINKTGGWLIMKEDTDTSSFRYAKGTTNFPANWLNRENLDYDYYYNLF